MNCFRMKSTMASRSICPKSAVLQQKGVSLIIVLLILVIVSILGAGGAQIAMMAERGSRNDRDMQVAWQAAEAALMDAEFDIHGRQGVPGSRQIIFKNMHDENSFVSGCGQEVMDRGLCTLNTTGLPAWLSVDFTATDNKARTAVFGEFTGRTFAASSGGASVGVQPAQAPRYIIEPIRDHVTDRNMGYGSAVNYVFRVTAMGFGPRPDIRAVSQIIYRD